jgi:hypothetical protein
MNIPDKEIERRRKISEAGKGRKKTAEQVAKLASILRGKKRTQEQNEANRQRAIKQFSNPESRERSRIKALEQWKDPDKRERCLEKIRENSQKKEIKLKTSATLKALWQSPEYRERQSKAHKGQKAWNKGKPMTEAYLRNMIAGINQPHVLETKRRKSKALWLNGDYIKKIQAAYHCKPNKPESMVMEILDRMYPGEWKYTGDFSFIINGKSPDFININGQKKIIELFGDYWHHGENEKDRADVFKPFGYETLVIWERELKKTDSLINKLERFCKI